MSTQFTGRFPVVANAGQARYRIEDYCDDGQNSNRQICTTSHWKLRAIATEAVWALHQLRDNEPARIAPLVASLNAGRNTDVIVALCDYGQEIKKAQAQKNPFCTYDADEHRVWVETVRTTLDNHRPPCHARPRA